MARVAIYLIILFSVAFLVWRGFRKDGVEDKPVDFIGNVASDLRVIARFLGKRLPYFIILGLCVAGYFFFTSINY